MQPNTTQHNTTLIDGSLAIARRKGVVNLPFEPAIPYPEDKPEDMGKMGNLCAAFFYWSAVLNPNGLETTQVPIGGLTGGASMQRSSYEKKWERNAASGYSFMKKKSMAILF